MNQNLLSRVLEFLRRKMWNKRWQRAVTCLGAVAVFGVTYALILPAITMTKVYPTLGAEVTEAWTGDELSVKVTAESQPGEAEKVIVLTMEGEGADLSDSYTFNEEGICVITDDAGREIELQRSIREDGAKTASGRDVSSISYWFKLAPGEETYFTLNLVDKFDEGRFASMVEAVKQSAEEAEAIQASSSDAFTASGTSKAVSAASPANASKASVSNASRASLSNADVAEANAIVKNDEEKVLVETNDDGFAEIMDGAVVNDLEQDEEDDGEQTETVADVRISAGIGDDYEAAVKDAAKNAEKRGDAQVRFTWCDVIAQKAASAKLVSYVGDATIAVFYDKAAGIPEGAYLSVSEIEEGTDEYEEYLAQTKNAMANATNNDTSKTVAHARFFDITIFDENGIEIKPASAVKVIITYNEAMELAEDGDLNVIHFKEDEPEVLAPAKPENGQEVDALSFTAESFSVYGVVGMETISTQYMTLSGDTYEVTVTYGSDAGIPENAELSVTELNPDAEENYPYITEAATQLSVDEKRFQYVKMLDISIMKDGEKVEISAPVEVSVKLLDKTQDTGADISAGKETSTTNMETAEKSKDTGDGAKTGMQVVHFGQTPQALEPASENGAVTFETPGFSVFVIVDIEDLPVDNRTQIFENDKFVITASYSEKAEIPENAVFMVSEISSENGSDYRDVVSKFEDLKNNSEDSLVKTDSIKIEPSQEILEALKMGFWNTQTIEGEEKKTGEEIEPKDTVFIAITFKDSSKYVPGQLLTITHFVSDDKDPEVTTVVLDDDNKTAFEVASFSDFVISEDGTVTYTKPNIPDPSWLHRVPNSNNTNFTRDLPYGTVVVEDGNLSASAAEFTTSNSNMLYRNGSYLYCKCGSLAPHATWNSGDEWCQLVFKDKALLHDGTRADFVMRFSNFKVDNRTGGTYNSTALNFFRPGQIHGGYMGGINNIGFELDCQLFIARPNDDGVEIPIEDEVFLFGFTDIDNPSYALTDYYKVSRINGENLGVRVRDGWANGAGASYNGGRYDNPSVYYSIPITDPDEKLQLADHLGNKLYYDETGGLTTDDAGGTREPVIALYKVVRTNPQNGTFRDLVLTLEPINYDESIDIKDGVKSAVFVPSGNALVFQDRDSYWHIDSTRLDGDPGTMYTGFFILCDSDGFTFRYHTYNDLLIALKSSTYYQRIRSSSGEGGSIYTYDTEITGQQVSYGPGRPEPVTLAVPKYKTATYYMIPEPLYHAKTITIWYNTYKGDEGSSTSGYRKYVIDNVDQLNWVNDQVTVTVDGRRFTFNREGGTISYSFVNVQNDWTIDVQWEADLPIDSIIITKEWQDNSSNSGGTRPNTLPVHLVCTENGNFGVDDNNDPVTELVTGIDANSSGNLSWTKGANIWTYVFQIPETAKQGSFALYENPVPTDYICNYFDEDHKLVITDFETVTVGDQQYLTGRATISNAIDTGGFSFTKKGMGIDGTESPLPGAVFTLYTDALCKHELEINGTVVTATSDSNGLVTFSNIPCRTFYMKETTVPSGYLPNTSVYVVSVHADSDESEITRQAQGSESGELSGSQGNYVILNDILRITVEIRKTDKTNTTLNLQGAKFKLYRGNYIQDPTGCEQIGDIYTTETNGRVTLGQLAIGTYSIVETETPPKYILAGADTIVFEVHEKDDNDKMVTCTASFILGSVIETYNQSTGTTLCTISVLNELGHALPNTGGSGTLPYKLSGILLLLASAFIYGFRMRREERRCS